MGEIRRRYHSGMVYEKEQIFVDGKGINTSVPFYFNPEIGGLELCAKCGLIYHGKDGVWFLNDDGTAPSRAQINTAVNLLLTQMNTYTDEQIDEFNKGIDRISSIRIDEYDIFQESYKERASKPKKYHSKNPQEGYVYMMQASKTDWYKIGVSSNPNRRLHEVGAKMPFEVTIYKSYFVSDMFGIEKLWHDLYSPYRVNNSEWFHLPNGISLFFECNFYSICHEYGHEMDYVDCWSYDMGIFPDGTPMTEEQIRAYEEDDVIPEMEV